MYFRDRKRLFQIVNGFAASFSKQLWLLHEWVLSQASCSPPLSCNKVAILLFADYYVFERGNDFFEMSMTSLLSCPVLQPS